MLNCPHRDISKGFTKQAATAISLNQSINQSVRTSADAMRAYLSSCFFRDVHYNANSGSQNTPTSMDFFVIIHVLTHFEGSACTWHTDSLQLAARAEWFPFYKTVLMCRGWYVTPRQLQNISLNLVHRYWLHCGLINGCLERERLTTASHSLYGVLLVNET